MILVMETKWLCLTLRKNGLTYNFFFNQDPKRETHEKISFIGNFVGRSVFVCMWWWYSCSL